MDVFVLQFRVLAPQILTIRVEGDSLEHTPYSQPKVSDTGLTTKSLWIPGYSIESHDLLLGFYLTSHSTARSVLLAKKDLGRLAGEPVPIAQARR